MLTNVFPGGRGQAQASVSDSGLWHRERGHFCRFRRPGLWPRVVGALGNRRPEHSTPGPPTSHRALGCHAVAALTPGSVPRTAVGTAGRSLAWVGLGASLGGTRRMPGVSSYSARPRSVVRFVLPFSPVRCCLLLEPFDVHSACSHDLVRSSPCLRKEDGAGIGTRVPRARARAQHWFFDQGHSARYCAAETRL